MFDSLQQRLSRWSARRRFRKLASQVTVGMTQADVQRLLGQPDVAERYDDESDFDSVWTFRDRMGEQKDFCLAFLAGRYSHGWSVWHSDKVYPKRIAV